MKLHDLHPASGSRRARTRVGRGIAAGRGKTAGRGTKGQRSRTGSSIPAWFEGGQTPIHMRVPKLRGFKNRFRVEYAVVNVGRVESALAEGRLEPGPRGAPATVNAELLFAAGLVGRLDRPLKILGGGDLTHKVLAVADAFSAEARRKIEAVGGTAMTLELPEASPPRARRPSSDVADSSSPGAPAEAVDAGPEPAEPPEPRSDVPAAAIAPAPAEPEVAAAPRSRRAPQTPAATPPDDGPKPGRRSGKTAAGSGDHPSDANTPPETPA